MKARLPLKLPDSFLEELRARTPLAALIGRRVKLSRSGRQMKGCCPFHGEKTPSFYVYDDGYHCFGCGAHGDAISFVMQTAGASFMEAVQSLAGEAGLDVPKPSPRPRRRSASAWTCTACWMRRSALPRRLMPPAGPPRSPICASAG